MMVYIAATEPLERVAWNDAQPAFYVAELHESEASVRQQFDTPHVLYAGSHEDAAADSSTGNSSSSKTGAATQARVPRCIRSLPN
ncbi:MAG: hypothetical protein MRJ68_12720 [Nitrospira sp.]|nr:hypothetical protein [Nitrospira sp.]